MYIRSLICLVIFVFEVVPMKNQIVRLHEGLTKYVPRVNDMPNISKSIEKRSLWHKKNHFRKFWREKLENHKLTLFFSFWVSFNEHSRFTGQVGKIVAIYLTLLYHFDPLQRHLDISRVVVLESSTLNKDSSRTRTLNLRFPSGSHIPINYAPLVPLTLLLLFKFYDQPYACRQEIWVWWLVGWCKLCWSSLTLFI